MSASEHDSSEQQRMRRVLAIFRTLATHMALDSRVRPDAGMHFSGRLGAISRAALAAVRAGADLHCLILDELVACAAPHACCSLEGPDVRLDAHAASVLSLAVHELAVNSLKFGALCLRGGHLEIRWHFQGSDQLVVAWTESGVTMDAEEERARGFGCEVVERLIRVELGGHGEMVFSGDGVRCIMIIPFRAGDAV
jgi:two-component sensor histidine kinase